MSFFSFPSQASGFQGVPRLVASARTPSLAALLFLAGLLGLSGCDRGGSPVGQPVVGTGVVVDRTGAVAMATAAAGGAPAPVRGGDSGTGAQWAAITNQFAVLHQAQAEVIQRLQARLDQLEKQDADAGALVRDLAKAREAERKSHEVREEQLQGRIAELETKVASLQAARVLPAITVAADDAPTVQELDQKIRIAERKHELAAEAAEARAKESPRLSVGASGFALSSADTNFVLRLRGLLQLDSRTFFQDNPLSQGNDGFVLRRARPILEGTVFRDVDFQFTPDFAGSSPQIFDAWLNYRLRPELQVRAGKFKGPVGFENQLTDWTLLFNERSMVSALVPVRNVGAQFWGEVAEGAFGYAAGIFNAGGDSRLPGSSNVGDDLAFSGRLSLAPFKHGPLSALSGLQLGVGGSYSEISSNAVALPGNNGGKLPGYTTSGLQQFFAYNPTAGSVVADGAHWRVSPYVSYLAGPFGLYGEYGISHQGVLNTKLQHRGLEHAAWEVTGQWVVTGEPASLSGLAPRNAFDPLTGKWGALQLVGRLGQLDIDSAAFPDFADSATAARRATAWSVGVNWWLNKNLRILTSYGKTLFDGGGTVSPLTAEPPATVSHQDESVFFTRLQLSF